MGNNFKIGVNILILTLLGTILFIYVTNNVFGLSASSILIAPKNNLNPGGENPQEEMVNVPLKQIMKSPVTLNQDDPTLIRKIRKKYLVPPSDEQYNLNDPNLSDPSKGQSDKIKELLDNKRNGFFIECGALDGETRSNTLFFEKEYGWKGVLIEGDPKNFELVLKKRRKAWAVPACLSTYAYPNVVMFSQKFNIGKISNIPPGSSSARDDLAEVQCLPIYSILLSLNVTSVDYFSLDVEGHELEVLRTIPWNRVNITTLSVEFIHGKDGKLALRRYMEEQGYKVYTEVTFKGGLANDFIFYHPRLLGKEIN